MNLTNTYIVDAVKEIIMEHITGVLINTTNPEEFQLTTVYINGAFSEGSDLDIAFEYKGSLNEDDVFNSLKAQRLMMDDIQVDFIPYHIDKGNHLSFEGEYIELWREDPIIFDKQKMLRMMDKDRLLKIAYKDLSKRNSILSDEEVLTIIFNSYILSDSEMEEKYRTA